MPSGDIVETAEEAAQLERPPLLVLERVLEFLDEHGLGSGALRARRIGEGGGSNFTFLLERDEGTFVLRRPPRPPLPPSAHDMVREARLQLALAPQGIRLPSGLENEQRRRRLADELVDTLVEIHAADVNEPALAAFARPGSYNERQ